MFRRAIPGLAALVLLACAAPAFAQHSAPAAPKGSTASLQSNDEASWIADPHWHAVYDLTRAAFAQGPAKVDVDAYEQKSFAIFRDFGASKGMKPEAMQDHLKLIPRQMVQIVKEDPHVLDSYDNFIAAGFGPR